MCLERSFSGTEYENKKLKNELIMIMSKNSNKVHSDEEVMMQKEEEVLNHNQEFLHADEEGNLNNAGSLKGVIESYPHIDKSTITR